MKLSPKQIEALKSVAAGLIYPILVREDDGWYARWCATAASSPSVDGWVDYYVRRATITRLTEDAEDQRHETLHDAWIMALRSETGLVRWDDTECAAFARELEGWSGSAAVDVEARRNLIFEWRANETSFEIVLRRPSTRAALRALGQATYLVSALTGLRLHGEMLMVSLTRGEAEDFVAHDAAALSQAGYTVRGVPKAAAVAAVLERENTKAEGPFRPRLVVRVAGESVTAAEVRFLLDQGSTLVYFRDRWIEVDRGILKEALRALEKGLGRKPTSLSFQAGLGHIGRLEVECEPFQLRTEKFTSPPAPAYLFSYQVFAFQWIARLTEKGYGALLADDMGLGKTIEAIAYLKSLPLEKAPALVVAPLTLLANWRHEFRRFEPGLKLYFHQGESRHLASGFARAARAAQVVLTSYNLLVKDYQRFAEIPWGALVLDEAQAIKNPDTQVARAVKALSPPRRLALTGTPIENSLQDIWSIEDFLNPGLLGDRASFQERFVRPLAFSADSSVALRLRRALAPLVLRRLKTDPEIALELGEKREVREYCALGPSDRRAYEAALAAFRHAEHTPGDALALLTELKLVCDGEGKLARLLDLVESIFENDESVLIFTQYVRVGAVITARLRERFSRTVRFLHGALSARAREAEIRAFKNSPGASAFVLSLRTGGFGLTLTKATHVIHFDRWWNPAVENQATDRAHRVGQLKNVLVHLLITEGTVEERIDELLKKKLSLGRLIADGNAFWEAVKLS